MSGPFPPGPHDPIESDGPDRRRPADSPRREPRTSSDRPADEIGEGLQRILFLDDDHRRAEVFLAWNPHAIWIQTAEDCIARLEEPWDEVYLDHDLGGEQYVDVERPDCGMEVVRWLCKESRPHPNTTRFVIHSHNMAAAMMMVLLMRETGYDAEFLPFGFSLEMDPLDPYKEAEKRSSGRRFSRTFSRWFRKFARLFEPRRKPPYP